MKILHILNDGPTDLSSRIIKLQTQEHDITVADLSAPHICYDDLVDQIAAVDRVISW